MGQELEASLELRRIVVGDLCRQDPVPESPRDDLGSLLVATIPPIGRRGVPGPQAPKLEEADALRPRHVLVNPDVPHLMEEVPARHLVHEHRADVDSTDLRVAEVAPASRAAPVEVDLDPGRVQPGTFEPRRRPLGESPLGWILREHHDTRPELQSRYLSRCERPGTDHRHQSEDGTPESTDRAHGRTVEPSA